MNSLDVAEEVILIRLSAKTLHASMTLNSNVMQIPGNHWKCRPNILTSTWEELQQLFLPYNQQQWRSWLSGNFFVHKLQLRGIYCNALCDWQWGSRERKHGGDFFSFSADDHMWRRGKNCIAYRRCCNLDRARPNRESRIWLWRLAQETLCLFATHCFRTE